MTSYRIYLLPCKDHPQGKFLGHFVPSEAAILLKCTERTIVSRLARRGWFNTDHLHVEGEL